MISVIELNIRNPTITFVICMAGLRIGKTFGTKLSNKAQILGGVILLGIGIEIFIKGIVA